MRHSGIAWAIGIMIVLLAFSVGTVRGSPDCSTAGTTGLNALIIAHSGQTITGAVDASGCDIGIYVGPGVHGVTVARATVSGANDHGIFVQDTSHFVLRDSTITGNGVAPLSCDFHAPPCILEDKAVELAGVSQSLIVHNHFVDDYFGGLGIADDGPTSIGGDPGAPNGGTAHAAVGNAVIGNLFEDVAGDCSVVIAAYDQGVGAYGNIVANNVILGSAPGTGPYVGQIVVATDGPNTAIGHTIVANNVVDGSILPGIVVHANVFGDVISNTVLVNNKLSDNGLYPSSFSTPNTPNDVPTGISIVAEGPPVNTLTPAPVITHTDVIADRVTNDGVGIWLCYSTGTSIHAFMTNAATPVATCTAGGS